MRCASATGWRVYGVSASISMFRERAPLVVTAAVDAGRVGQALHDTLDALKSFDERERRPGELQFLKNQMLAWWPDSFDTVNQSLKGLETIAKLDLPVDTWTKLRDAVQALTADDLARVAKKYLDPARAQLVVLGEVSRFKADLDALGIAEVEIRKTHWTRDAEKRLA